MKAAGELRRLRVPQKRRETPEKEKRNSRKREEKLQKEGRKNREIPQKSAAMRART